MLAEDGYDNRRFIETVLRKAGAEVESVENCRLAVARAEAETFDLILMDIYMPGMDGLEATWRLRDGGYTRPIMALTANAITADVHAAGRPAATNTSPNPSTAADCSKQSPLTSLRQ